MANSTVPNEQCESETFSQWLTLNNIKHHHGNDNMFTRSWGQKIKMKKAGFSKGYPDFTVITRQGLLFIEMKRAKKSLSHISDEQKEWLEALQGLSGVEATVCWGADEAIDFVKSFV